ncbi:hypothetical protein NPIL_170901 [Nephila pilipes]|uniref:Uncharacterized protein n=1 Tax=Nephila pilipes TaxID=299642 RepID=A0A8X6MKD0_NEPPI|nr:hypothetical protein NPIL_170901 [Nephila pilipes]
MSPAQKQEKRLFSEINTSVSTEGIFFSESNKNLVGAILCQNSNCVMCDNSDSVMSGVVHSPNDFRATERDFVCPDCFQAYRDNYNWKRLGYKFQYNNT